MMTRRLWIFVVGVALLLSTGFALAADQEPAQQTVQFQEQEQIYGSQLMTKEERAEYRAKLRAAKTKEEREQIRKEHHERMKERADAQGVTLPDEPPAIGGGMGPGGGGMGPGGGGMRSGGGGMGPGGGGMGPGGGGMGPGGGGMGPGGGGMGPGGGRGRSR